MTDIVVHHLVATSPRVAPQWLGVWWSSCGCGGCGGCALDVVDVVVMHGIGHAVDVMVVVVMHSVQLLLAVVSKVGWVQGGGSTYLCRNINNNSEQ